MYYYSPKLAREIKDIWTHEKIRWIASRYRALEVLANNYPTMVNHMDKLSEQNTASNSDNFAKATSYLSSVKKIKSLQYLYFMINLFSYLRNLCLLFPKDEILVCSISSQIQKQIAIISNLVDNPGPRCTEFETKLAIGENIVYGGINLSDRPSILAITRKTSREDQDDNGECSKLFSSLISDVVLYLEKRFERFEAEPVVWFKVFHTDKWPLHSASLKLFGNKEIKNLLNYYKNHNYLSEECANTAEREWPAKVVSR